MAQALRRDEEVVACAPEGAGDLERLSKPTRGSFVRRNNQRFRRTVSDLTLDKLILSEAAKGVVAV